MKLKLFKKYFLTTAIIIVASLTAMMLILTFVLNNYIANDKHKTLSKSCYEIAEYIESVKEQKITVNVSDYYDVITTVSDISDADIFICDTNGNVAVCSCKDWAQNKNCVHSKYKIEQEQLDSVTQDQQLHLTTLGIYEKPHYVTAVNVKLSSGNGYGTVIASAPMSIIKNLLSAVTKLYFFSAIIPMVIMFFAIYGMTYKMTKPLKLMSEASHAMARGDFSRRIPVTSDDEIGELAVSFNMMTNNLASLEGMRRSFVANVSHELRTPMTTIGGLIDGI